MTSERYFFLSEASIPSNSPKAASTVLAGPVSLKNTEPFGWISYISPSTLRCA